VVSGVGDMVTKVGSWVGLSVGSGVRDTGTGVGSGVGIGPE